MLQIFLNMTCLFLSAISSLVFTFSNTIIDFCNLVVSSKALDSLLSINFFSCSNDLIRSKMKI